MGKWVCKVCGYTHNGEEAPEHCPQCNAPKSQFYLEGQGKGCVFSILAIIVIVSLVLLASIGCSSSSGVDNSTVETMDLDRYMGKWYEIARYNHKFEKGLEYCTATYAMQDDGTIRVTNYGKKNGKWTKTVGKGKVSDTPGLLSVSFFGPFYSDYRVMMVDSGYNYALVGGDDDDYLWILSRTPQLNSDVREEIVQEANSRGYDTDALIWVKQ